MSYVIPAHNAAGAIRQTLLACTDQRDADDRPIACEVLVVDDASTDTTVALASQVAMAAPGHAIVRCLAASGETGSAAMPVGPALARRAGLVHAVGEFVCFLDADDVPVPHHASALLAAIEGARADAATGGCEIVDEHLEPLHLHLIPEPYLGDFAAVCTANRLSIGPTVVRRDKLLGAMRAEPEMFKPGQRLEDWVMWICLARWSERKESGGIRWAPSVRSPLVAYRQVPTSRSRATIANLHAGVEIVRRFAPAEQQAGAAAQLARGAICEALLDGEMAQLREASSVLGELLSQEDLNGSARQGETHPTGDDAFATPLHWSLGIRGWLRPERLTEALNTLPASFARVAGAGPNVDWKRLLCSCLCSAEAVGEAAKRLARTVAPSQRLIIYGLGQNGQAALRAVAGAANIAVIDDDRSKPCPVQRITIAELLGTDVVLITPVRRGEILTRLSSAPCRVALPEDVLRDVAAS